MYNFAGYTLKFIFFQGWEIFHSVSWVSTEAAENSAISAIFSNTQKVSKLQNTNYLPRGYTMKHFSNNL